MQGFYEHPSKRQAPGRDAESTVEEEDEGARLWLLSASMLPSASRAHQLVMATPADERKVRSQQACDVKDGRSGSGRVFEELHTRPLGSMDLAYRSWTRVKHTAAGNRTSHRALLTVDGVLLAKLEWIWTRSEAERMEREQAEVSLYKTAVTATMMRLHGSSAVGLQFNSWDLVSMVAAFCIHYGPKGQRYCLLDFVAGHERAFALTTMRVLSRKFLTTKKLDSNVDVVAAAAAAAAATAMPVDDDVTAETDVAATVSTPIKDGRTKMRASRDPAPLSPASAGQE